MKYTMKDFVERPIAVRVHNDRERKAFLKMCDEHGLIWRTGAEATQAVLHENFGDQLCISCNFYPGEKRRLSYADTWFFKREGWVIVNFSDIVQEKKKDNGFRIVIECMDGKTTTAKLTKLGTNEVRVVKTVEAKCNPADKFNLRIGAQTAFDRLWERSAE